MFNAYHDMKHAEKTGTWELPGGFNFLKGMIIFGTLVLCLIILFTHIPRTHSLDFTLSEGGGGIQSSLAYDGSDRMINRFADGGWQLHCLGRYRIIRVPDIVIAGVVITWRQKVICIKTDLSRFTQ